MSKGSDLATIYQRPVELLQDLIRFDTTNPPGNEGECIAYINHLLNVVGIETILPARDPSRPNLIARIPGQGNAPPLLLYGHVDVVTTENQTWQYPPFEGKVIDGYIWGRGTLDMKGGVAMMVAALLRAKVEGLMPPGDVILAILSDEELGSALYGARYLIENHANLFEGVRYAIGEFGGYTSYVGKQKFYPIMVAEKQICIITATVRGPSGHPLGLIARGGTMAKLANLLQQLDKQHLPVHITPVVRQMYKTMASVMPFPSDLVLFQVLNPVLTNWIPRLFGTQMYNRETLLHNTVNVTAVRGGVAGVIPSDCRCTLVGGLLPGFSPDELVAELRCIVGNEVEFETIHYDPGPSDTDMTLFETLSGILREADPDGTPLPILGTAITDARLFSRLGIQTYGFLPMKLPPEFNFLQTIHAADERIPVEALSFGTDAIYKLLQRF
jgi:acetylornithine deacetylase/succinyl-diaminopimelate desuccinylase-like protein